MERLKDAPQELLINTAAHLHSSMERLKDVFQRALVLGIVKFTFQYGEIKSAVVVDTAINFTKIYIPVWRD